MKLLKIVLIIAAVAWGLIFLMLLHNMVKKAFNKSVDIPSGDTVALKVDDTAILFVFFDKNPKAFEDSIVNQVEAFYGVHVDVTHDTLPPSTYIRKFGRYRAPLINEYLETIRPSGYDKVVGITQHDISDKKSDDEDFGIYGEARDIYSNVCIISNYRLKNKNKGLLITTLHEMGHCYGLFHCLSKHCLMVSGGEVPLKDGKPWLCFRCIKMIR